MSVPTLVEKRRIYRLVAMMAGVKKAQRESGLILRPKKEILRRGISEAKRMFRNYDKFIGIGISARKRRLPDGN